VVQFWYLQKWKLSFASKYFQTELKFRRIGFPRLVGDLQELAKIGLMDALDAKVDDASSLILTRQSMMQKDEEQQKIEMQAKRL
jgi:hypothetical protein